jgi:hypothetical protein
MPPAGFEPTIPERKQTKAHALYRAATGIGLVSVCLTFQSLAVTLRTARFNIKNFYVVPTLRLCVLYGSQNKQQLLAYKTSRDWFL